MSVLLLPSPLSLDIVQHNMAAIEASLHLQSLPVEEGSHSATADNASQNGYENDDLANAPRRSFLHQIAEAVLWYSVCPFLLPSDIARMCQLNRDSERLLKANISGWRSAFQSICGPIPHASPLQTLHEESVLSDSTSSSSIHPFVADDFADVSQQVWQPSGRWPIDNAKSLFFALMSSAPLFNSNFDIWEREVFSLLAHFTRFQSSSPHDKQRYLAALKSGSMQVGAFEYSIEDERVAHFVSGLLWLLSKRLKRGSLSTYLSCNKSLLESSFPASTLPTPPSAALAAASPANSSAKVLRPQNRKALMKSFVGRVCLGGMKIEWSFRSYLALLWFPQSSKAFDRLCHAFAMKWISEAQSNTNAQNQQLTELTKEFHRRFQVLRSSFSLVESSSSASSLAAQLELLSLSTSLEHLFFASLGPGALYVLCYSLLMLSTEIYSKVIKNKVPKDTWTRRTALAMLEVTQSDRAAEQSQGIPAEEDKLRFDLELQITISLLQRMFENANDVPLSLRLDTLEPEGWLQVEHSWTGEINQKLKEGIHAVKGFISSSLSYFSSAPSSSSSSSSSSWPTAAPSQSSFTSSSLDFTASPSLQLPSGPVYANVRDGVLHLYSDQSKSMRLASLPLAIFSLGFCSASTAASAGAPATASESTIPILRGARVSAYDESSFLLILANGKQYRIRAAGFLIESKDTALCNSTWMASMLWQSYSQMYKMKALEGLFCKRNVINKNQQGRFRDNR